MLLLEVFFLLVHQVVLVVMVVLLAVTILLAVLVVVAIEVGVDLHSLLLRWSIFGLGGCFDVMGRRVVL